MKKVIIPIIVVFAILTVVSQLIVRSNAGPDVKYLNGCQAGTCIKIGEETDLLFHLDVTNLEQKYQYKDVYAEILIDGKKGVTNRSFVKVTPVENPYKNGIKVRTKFGRVKTDHMGRINPQLRVKVLPFVEEGAEISIRFYGTLTVAELDGNDALKEVEHEFSHTFTRKVFKEIEEVIEE